MTSENLFPKTRAVLAALGRLGFEFQESTLLDRAGEFRRLCSTWNLSAKLMSPTDLSERFDDHVADSLSLAPYLRDGAAPPTALVDVGAGAGFPGIPLCLLAPTLQTFEIERSETKATFLRQALSRLMIDQAKVLQENFPQVSLPDMTLVYTARAVESPADVDRAIIKRLKPGDSYLVQRQVPELSGNQTATVEKLEDEFSKSGLRRGVLYRIRR